MKTNLEILKGLNAITKKIQENTIGAWEHDLEGTTEAVITEDHRANEAEEPIKYNGWVEDLAEITEAVFTKTFTQKKVFYLFGENINIAFNRYDEKGFLAYAKDDNNFYGMFIYIEGETSPNELLDAMNGWFAYTEISEELFNKIKETV